MQPERTILPANDNPVAATNELQLEMFGESRIIGVDWGRAPSIGAVAEVDRRGRVVGLRVVEGGPS